MSALEKETKTARRFGKQKLRRPAKSQTTFEPSGSGD
jgi:hypothetical protein